MLWVKMTRERTTQLTKTQARRGFTLLEALIASVVLVVLALGVVAVISTSYEQSESVRATSTGVTLARQLTDEIVSKPFNSGDALGAGSYTTRSQYTVSSYNGYQDSSTAITPYAGGTAVDATGSDIYTRTCAVTVGAKASGTGISASSTNFAIVTVNVTCPNGQIVSVPEFVAQYPIPRQ
jgi:prepilin-type N-terminal cleavage/methylation domain-containing protein